MSKQSRILVADDDTTFLEAAADLLRHDGFECDATTDAYTAKEMLGKKNYDLLIADIRMPGNQEMELIKGLKDIAYGLPIILVTGFPSLETAIMSTRLAVAGYLRKPVDFDDLLKLTRESIARYKSLREFYGMQKCRGESHQGRENMATSKSSAAALSSHSTPNVSQTEMFHSPTVANTSVAALRSVENEDTLNHEYFYAFENIVYRSKTMSQVVDTIKRTAASDSNVLIFGETGTGKELIARAIHRFSSRKNGDFVPVDCVAIPSNLLESEFFGFEKGAFTGAVSRKYGLLEFAHNGTLFLDEISELEINLQAKLLRVLEERQFRRIGGKELIEVDIRVLAAMNRNPARAVATNRLRRDLYYRLNVIPIYVPPLRDRIDDIPLLVKQFMRTVSARNPRVSREISPEAIELLKSYGWPGNVRQLKNIVERLVSLSKHPVIEADDLPGHIRAPKSKSERSIFCMPFNDAKKRHLELFEKKYFRELFSKANHDLAEAAQIAGLSVRTIYRMIHRYGKL